MTFVVKCAPVFKDWHWCCCSCSLRVASLVLAWFTAVTNLTQLVSCIVYLSHPNIVPYKNAEVIASFLSSLIGALIFDALLLYGIHRKKPAYMLPFLVMDLIALVVMCGIILLITAFFLPGDWKIGITIFSAGSAMLALATFFWVVHYSYYRQIEEEKNSTFGIVNYTYGIPSGQVQITACPEDEKALCPYPTKGTTEMA